MPSRNVYKIFVKDGFYHVYNRGVEKRKIFLDKQDYQVFLNNLKIYLSHPPDPKDLKSNFTLKGTTFKGIPRQPKNYYKKIELLAYCLMPNHFHLLIKQNDKNSMKDFMQSLIIKYSMYFNKKYKRVGQLFQGRYKAVLVDKDNYLLHLSRYIHLNPLKITSNLLGAHSSYGDYLGNNKSEWVNTGILLKYFDNLTIPEIRKYNSYRKFVEEYSVDSKNILGNLTIEKEP